MSLCLVAWLPTGDGKEQAVQGAYKRKPTVGAGRLLRLRGVSTLEPAQCPALAHLISDGDAI